MSLRGDRALLVGDPLLSSQWRVDLFWSTGGVAAKSPKTMSSSAPDPRKRAALETLLLRSPNTLGKLLSLRTLNEGECHRSMSSTVSASSSSSSSSLAL